jgi:hypothetical protein
MAYTLVSHLAVPEPTKLTPSLLGHVENWFWHSDVSKSTSVSPMDSMLLVT